MSEDCPHCLYEKTHANCPGCWEGSHYRPKPSEPRPIHGTIDHYDVDVETGTVTYHVVRTNGDRIRAQTDEGLAKLMEHCGCCPPLACPHNEVGVYVTPQDCEMCWLEWLKSPAEVETDG